jgi:hypothetical protein
MSKKHKKQDEEQNNNKPETKRNGRYHWLQISTDNWLRDGVVRKLMRRRRGYSDAFILQVLYLAALQGDEIGCVMAGLYPANINKIKDLAEYLDLWPTEVNKTIEICRELGLIIVIGTEIWMTQIYRYIGSSATKQSNHDNYMTSLLERAKATKAILPSYNQGKENSPVNIAGEREFPRHIAERTGIPPLMERNRTGSQPGDRFIENQKDSINKSRQPLFQGADTNGKVKGGEDVKTSKELVSASPLSWAGENAGDVKPSATMKKIFEDIGEDDEPFNGNGGGLNFGW